MYAKKKRYHGKYWGKYLSQIQGEKLTFIEQQILAS